MRLGLPSQAGSGRLLRRLFSVLDRAGGPHGGELPVVGRLRAGRVRRLGPGAAAGPGLEHGGLRVHGRRDGAVVRHAVQRGAALRLRARGRLRGQHAGRRVPLGRRRPAGPRAPGSLKLKKLYLTIILNCKH